MSDMEAVLKDLSDIKRRLSRLEARDPVGVGEWTAWTPELYGSTGAGTITYTTQVGYYLVLDALVYIWGLIDVNTVTVAPTGSMRIRTLPITTSANIDNLYMQPGGRINMTAGYTQMAMVLDASVTYMRLAQVGDNVAFTEYPAASFTAADVITFSGFYQID